MRRKTRLGWGLYAATLAMGLYTQLFTVLVAIGHGIFVVATTGCRLSKTLKAYLLATTAALIAFLPWLVFILSGFESSSWIERSIPLSTLATRWALNLGSLFLDVQIGYSKPLFDISLGNDAVQFNLNNPWVYGVIFISVIEVYSVDFLYQKTPQRGGIFLVTLMGAIALPLLRANLVSGGQRSGVGRYLIPSYLSIQIAVAYLIVDKLNSQQLFWRLIVIALISSSILSCTIASQADTWWNKYSSYYNPQVAHILNNAANPLVIVYSAIRAISLSYILKQNGKFMIVENTNYSQINNNFYDVYLFQPSEDLHTTFEKERIYKFESVFAFGELWQLKK